MRKVSNLYAAPLGVLAVCALLACGSVDDGGTPVGGGEVVAPWDGFCVATFTEDYAFVDPFGDAELRVKRGGRYLMSDFGDFGAAATILYLGRGGQADFSVDVEQGAPLPFTSNCMEGSVMELLGVFADVTVYMDEALTMPVCMLAAGTTLPDANLSFGLVSGDLFAGEGTYEVSSDGFAAACGGLTIGYVEASTVEIGSGQHTSVPLAPVIAPLP